MNIELPSCLHAFMPSADKSADKSAGSPTEGR